MFGGCVGVGVAISSSEWKVDAAVFVDSVGAGAIGFRGRIAVAFVSLTVCVRVGVEF